MYYYHYCAVRPIDGGGTQYADGAINCAQKLTEDDLPRVREVIAQDSKWPVTTPCGFNIISLTLLNP